MTHQVKGLPIFKAGRWNGDDYSTADLDAMVDAFDKVGFRPPVKLGHDESIGARAWGWVSRIWREGSQLFADLVDIPAQVFDVIKQRGFDAVSSEIFWDLERNGKKFSRVLKGLALLGSEVPAVDLPPIRSATLLGVTTEYRSYTMTINDNDTDDNDPGAQLTQLAQGLAVDEDLDFSSALQKVMRHPRNARLVAAYNQRPAGAARPAKVAERRPSDAASRNNASVAIHNKAVAILTANPDMPYREAVSKALKAEPDAARAWVGN